MFKKLNLPKLVNLFQSGLPTASLFSSSYISKKKSPNRVLHALADDHRGFRSFDEGFANFSRGEILLYQSKKFLENEIRTRLTNK